MHETRKLQDIYSTTSTDPNSPLISNPKKFSPVKRQMLSQPVSSLDVDSIEIPRVMDIETKIPFDNSPNMSPLLGKRVEAPRQPNYETLINASATGPFGCSLLNMDSLDGLVCFVQGIGLVGISQLIFDTIEFYPHKRIILFWSVRNTDYISISLFRGKN
jgi:hypothetical protein